MNSLPVCFRGLPDGIGFDLVGADMGGQYHWVRTRCHFDTHTHWRLRPNSSLNLSPPSDLLHLLPNASLDLSTRFNLLYSTFSSLTCSEPLLQQLFF